MKPTAGEIRTIPIAGTGRRGIVTGGTLILHPAKIESFERPGHLTQRGIPNACILFYSAGNRLDQINKKMKLVKWVLEKSVQGKEIENN